MDLNTQPISKTLREETPFLQIQSIFTTIQGEGPFAGMPAIFIRLGGCNLQCPFCDTDYSSSIALLTIEDILDRIAQEAPRLVVITGGEPFRQNLKGLVAAILMTGRNVQIETNGSLFQDLPYELITVVCSPKTGSIHPKLLPYIQALKYVVAAGAISEQDGLPITALGHPNSGFVARPPYGFPFAFVYVQPIDVQDPAENAIHLQAAVHSCEKFGYRLSLQIHKIAGLA